MVIGSSAVHPEPFVLKDSSQRFLCAAVRQGVSTQRVAVGASGGRREGCRNSTITEVSLGRISLIVRCPRPSVGQCATQPQDASCSLRLAACESKKKKSGGGIWSGGKSSWRKEEAGRGGEQTVCPSICFPVCLCLCLPSACSRG